MPTTILQATVGAGKTEAALQRLAQVANADPHVFPKIWVLLATKRQEVAFRERLALLDDAQSVYFNVEFFEFYELNNRLLRLAAQPARRIKEPARFGLLRHILTQMHAQGQLNVFAPIATKGGFVRAVADLIYELKQNLVYPEHFRRVADASDMPKDRELALIYQRYQDILREHELVDREGEGWLALSVVQAQPQLGRDVRLLLVDGYDQFTESQAHLLAALSERIEDVAITLTNVPEREATIGRRFERALQRLRKAHAGKADLHTETLPDLTNRHPELLTLGQHIQQDVAPVEPQADVSRVQLIEAPEPPQEVAAVLRRVKVLLLDGARPDDIMIVLRDWSLYTPHFEAYGQLYGLPLLLHHTPDLLRNPALVALLDVLRLSDGPPDPQQPNKGFRRRAVLDVLRSPYVHVPGLADPRLIDLLERVSREKTVVGGRELWLEALDAAAEMGFADEEAADDADAEARPLLTPHDASELSLALEDFFNRVTPPASDTLDNYVSWIEGLIGDEPTPDSDDDPDIVHPSDAYTLGMLACIRAPENTPQNTVVHRDLEALSSLKDVLRSALSTQEMLRSLRMAADSRLTWRDFFADLLADLEATPGTRRDPMRNGRVLVTTAADARGLPHPHVFVLGLAEGVFPAPTSEDVLYLDRERRHLQLQGVQLLTQDERADDEGVFYELTSLPRETLVLSRPTVRAGQPWNESYLWRLVEEVFTRLTRERYSIGQVLPAAQVASLDEALLTAIAGADTPQTLHGLRSWLAASPQRAAHWSRVLHGITTEARRLSNAAHDNYSGRLQDPAHIEHAAAAFDPQRAWSASRLNDFGACAYRYFAKHVLKLATLDEPEAGLDALLLGTINHRILEVTYDEIRAEALTITPENADDALAILAQVAADVLDDAPQTYKFQPDMLWRQQRQMILLRLNDLVKRDFSADSPLNKYGGPRRVYQLEAPFGLQGAPTASIPISAGNNDNLHEETLHTRGKIDRIDIVEGQNALIVVDYKSNSGTISTQELANGRNVQMLIYVAAVQDMLRRARANDLHVQAGVFWHINSRKLSTHYIADDEARAEDIAQAQAHILRYLAQGRVGDFAVQPSRLTQNQRCTSYCEFYQLCRVMNISRFKDV
jgi:ATP-dependent helicase/nuclease subunit B